MATIFLSYRRNPDGAQACRVREFLASRFGQDAVFMDVEDTPLAVSYARAHNEAVSASKVVVALIGVGWADRLGDPEDPVRLELEWALAADVPILPVLVGSTPMPGPETLPDSLASVPYQNAHVVSVLQGFNSHMQALVHELERLLGRLTPASVASASRSVINDVCDGVRQFLKDRYWASTCAHGPLIKDKVEVIVINPLNLPFTRIGVTLILNRESRLDELLDLHLLLSFWAKEASEENLLASWTLHEMERAPVLPEEHFLFASPRCDVRVRQSTEDPRQLWQMMVPGATFQRSQAYIVTVAPRSGDGGSVGSHTGVE